MRKQRDEYVDSRVDNFCVLTDVLCGGIFRLCITRCKLKKRCHSSHAQFPLLTITRRVHVEICIKMKTTCN